MISSKYMADTTISSAYPCESSHTRDWGRMCQPDKHGKFEQNMVGSNPCTPQKKSEI